MAKTRAKTTKKKTKKKTAKKVTKKKVTKKASSKKKTTAKKVAPKKTVTRVAAMPTWGKNLLTLMQSIDAKLNTLLGAPVVVKTAGPVATNKTTTLGDASVSETSLFENQPTTNGATTLTKDDGPTTLTKDDIAQALQGVMAVAGQDVVKQILNEVGANRVSEITTDNYEDVMAACEKQSVASPAQIENAQTENSATSLFGN